LETLSSLSELKDCNISPPNKFTPSMSSKNKKMIHA